MLVVLFREKHFPWVWQLEQNKRLLFASCRGASHNTQLTACCYMIHSQSWECLRSEKYMWCALLLAFLFFFKATNDRRMCLLFADTYSLQLKIIILMKNTFTNMDFILLGETIAVSILKCCFNQRKKPLALKTLYIPFPLGQTMRPPMTRP